MHSIGLGNQCPPLDMKEADNTWTITHAERNHHGRKHRRQRRECERGPLGGDRREQQLALTTHARANTRT
eukprot:2060786-Alexandrium_andersonii.AAC.1